MSSFKILAAVAACVAIGAGLPRAVAGSPKLSVLEWNGQTVEGRVLNQDGVWLRLVGKDGCLWELPQAEVSNLVKQASPFRAYEPGELRSLLVREFGSGMEVHTTAHYVVVHPKGERDLWPPRFEELYRSFVHFFNVRGCRLDTPRYPLVAVVFKDKQDFLRYAQNEGSIIQDSFLGYYSRRTNRVALYDTSDGKENKDSWQQNASTIIHEATHQTAFNTGLHGRFSQAPRWMVEGLGTLYEARGFHDSRKYPKEKDRYNLARLEGFRQSVAPQWQAGSLARLIGEDRFFEADMHQAYALSWAFSFYLMETQPRKYTQYLQRTSKRRTFDEYTQAERLADFTGVFGNDLTMVEAKFLRFMDELD